MSLVDSAAAFERKCKDAKNGEDLFNGLKALGVTDFNTLAFTLGTPQKAALRGNDSCGCQFE